MHFRDGPSHHLLSQVTQFLDWINSNAPRICSELNVCCIFILSSKRHLLLRCSSQTSIPEMVEQIMWNVVGKTKTPENKEETSGERN